MEQSIQSIYYRFGCNASMEKFQIILYPKLEQDGDIVIQYHTVDNPGITPTIAL